MITLYIEKDNHKCELARDLLLKEGLGFNCYIKDVDFTEEQLSGITHLRQLPLFEVNGAIGGGFYELRRWLRSK